MLSFEEINILGNILNTSFGKSSTNISPTMSIKGSISGDILTLTYTTIITLVSEINMRDQVKNHDRESVKLIDDYVKICKKDFKVDAGSALKLKELSSTDTIEIISTSPYTLKRPAYYKRITNYRIS